VPNQQVVCLGRIINHQDKAIAHIQLQAEVRGEIASFTISTGQPLIPPGAVAPYHVTISNYQAVTLPTIGVHIQSWDTVAYDPLFYGEVIEAVYHPQAVGLGQYAVRVQIRYEGTTDQQANITISLSDKADQLVAYRIFTPDAPFTPHEVRTLTLWLTPHIKDESLSASVTALAQSANYYLGQPQ